MSGSHKEFPKKAVFLQLGLAALVGIGFFVAEKPAAISAVTDKVTKPIVAAAAKILSPIGKVEVKAEKTTKAKAKKVEEKDTKQAGEQKEAKKPAAKKAATKKKAAEKEDVPKAKKAEEPKAEEMKEEPKVEEKKFGICGPGTKLIEGVCTIVEMPVIKPWWKFW